MKKKFLASLLMVSLMTPVLTGCFFSGGGGDSPTVDPGEEEDTPSIVVVEDDFLSKYEGSSSHWYNLKLAKNYEYTLNVNLGDYSGSNYYLEYSFDVTDTYKDCVSLNNNVLQTKSTAEVGDKAYLVVRLKQKGKNKTYAHESIFVTVMDPSAYITATLTSKSDDVQIKDSTSTLYDYSFTIPMSGKLYQMPLIEVNHVEGEYTLDYASKNDGAIEFSEEREETFFKLNPGASEYGQDLYIDVKGASNETLRRFVCRLSISYNDPDVFQMFYGNNRSQMKNAGTMLVEKSTSYVPLDFYFNNSRVSSASNSLQINIEDNTIVNNSRKSTIYGYNHVLDVLKTGTTTVTIEYNKGNAKERTIEFTVNVYDGKKLSSVYVPMGSDAFEIDGDDVIVNGKIYATFEVGEPEAINGYDDLVITKSDTSDPNVKNVNLSYTYKGDTKEASYQVEVNKSSGYQKTKLTQNYKTYWNQAGRVATPYEGEVKVLAIPVWFNNSSDFINLEKSDDNNHNQKEQIIEDLTTNLFGSNDEVVSRSLKTYYLEESFGRMKISGKVTPWYEINHENTYYGDHDTKITDLAKDAVNWYFNESGTSDTISDFDGNGDGVIDSVIIYYGANYHCLRNGYFVSSAWMRRLNNTSSGFSNYAWISVMDMYGTSGLSPQAYGQYNANDLSSIHGIDAKTTIHEFAHAIGASDVYDTAMKSTPTGSFNMQSSDKGSHDAYNLMAMGYANPYVFSSNDSTLDNSFDIEINDMQSSGDMILLTPSWSTANEIFDEYLLLELYTPTGLNTYDANYTTPAANCTGIRLWHVNAVRDNSTHQHRYTNNSETSNYDLLHFIRNDKEETYRSLTTLKEEYLFKQGESFSMDEFKSQFYNNNGKLDNGNSLGWSFQVKTITKDVYGNAKAVITLTKVA